MIEKIRAAIHSGEPVKRLTHEIGAQLWYRAPIASRRWLFQGEQHTCPICDNNIRQFLPISRDFHAYCPVCRSLQRHRLVWLYLQQSGLLDQQARFLHLAPEACLREKFATNPNWQYLSADMFDPSAMVRMDICNIEYPDNSFDVIYCSHVLEHVADDRQALAEFRRVLSPDGVAILLVPIFSETTTFEDPAVTDPVERMRLFGQHDHVRAYGPDFAQRVGETGFKVECVTASDLTDAAHIHKMRLEENETIFVSRPS